MKRKVSAFFVALALLTIPLTSSATIALPPNLIGLSSPQGANLFNRSYSAAYFWPLNLQFVTQETKTYCSIASSVMVLNALNIPPPVDSIYAPFKIFTQNNFFTPAVEKILPVASVKKHGATLDQISRALMTFPVSISTIHTNNSSIDQFRTLARKIIDTQSGYIIVNFLRTGLGEEGMGHMSPLAAYDKQTDRFLVLDVARYRYSTIWVKTQDLWNAMNTVDQDSKSYRGFIIIQRKY